MIRSRKKQGCKGNKHMKAIWISTRFEVSFLAVAFTYIVTHVGCKKLFSFLSYLKQKVHWSKTLGLFCIGYKLNCFDLNIWSANANLCSALCETKMCFVYIRAQLIFISIVQTFPFSELSNFKFLLNYAEITKADVTGLQKYNNVYLLIYIVVYS